MKRVSLAETRSFRDQGAKMFLVHESPYLKVINFNFQAGQELPIHCHESDGQLTILVIEGEGVFLAAAGETLPAREGDLLVSDIAEPHGLRASTDMRVVVTIAPPI